ncbi:ARGOS-like protein [Juglans microcarpa x Juglans regia]|uniref:ARGOS-like protein n=1 Tax=Juglans microcarpa x Juglans regia TaxID=2249226 RepID=UPI001B7F3189|nr:ARGOS-like protein [Juglans microcarpa x Juglans regia]
MRFELPEVDLRLLKGLICLQNHSASCIMDARSIKVPGPLFEGKKIEYQRSLSHGKGSSRRLLAASYFSLESLLLLVCLTASLLILPLILPPLPPPPFMLLLLPIGILAVLMVLAFMPSNVRDITYTYV